MTRVGRKPFFGWNPRSYSTDQRCPSSVQPVRSTACGFANGELRVAKPQATDAPHVDAAVFFRRTESIELQSIVSILLRLDSTSASPSHDLPRLLQPLRLPPAR